MLKELFILGVITFALWLIGYPIYRKRRKLSIFINGSIYALVLNILALYVCILKHCNEYKLTGENDTRWGKYDIIRERAW